MNVHRAANTLAESGHNFRRVAAMDWTISPALATIQLAVAAALSISALLSPFKNSMSDQNLTGAHDPLRFALGIDVRQRVFSNQNQRGGVSVSDLAQLVWSSN